jgi:hypothetical protein
MPVRLTDEHITKLLQERKPLPADWHPRLVPKQRRGRQHKEAHLDTVGAAGSVFRISIRQSAADPGSFAVVLSHRPLGTTEFVRLRRYNGSHWPHTNPIEKTVVDGCHIHIATERYQDRGADAETFAEPTDRFSDINGALQLLIEECRFDVPKDPGSLFG